MEHANANMMGRIAEIENCILGGFVLDDRGNWVSLADKKASEEDFLAHLEAGRVLHNGQWVNFEDAKKAPARRQTVPPGPLAAAPPPLPDPAKEEETDSGVYPPETKVIQTLPPVFELEEPTSDPVSGYAPETGLFVFEPVNAADTVQSGQKQEKKTPATPAIEIRETKRIPSLSPPSIPSWEKEESRDKKRTIIIGGAIVVFAAIAAAVAIMMQIVD